MGDENALKQIPQASGRLVECFKSRLVLKNPVLSQSPHKGIASHFVTHGCGRAMSWKHPCIGW